VPATIDIEILAQQLAAAPYEMGGSARFKFFQSIDDVDHVTALQFTIPTGGSTIPIDLQFIKSVYFASSAITELKFMVIQHLASSAGVDGMSINKGLSDPWQVFPTSGIAMILLPDQWVIFGGNTAFDVSGSENTFYLDNVNSSQTVDFLIILGGNL